jgi:hypothetical protein
MFNAQYPMFNATLPIPNDEWLTPEIMNARECQECQGRTGTGIDL